MLLVLAATGCGSASSGPPDDVVAAFYPLAFAAEQVGPADARVRDLTPAGAEPHDLELRAADVEAIRRARLVAYLGGGFQPALEDALAGRTGPSLDLLRGQRLLPAAEGEGLDPHVWLDPLRFATMARQLATALGDPTRADPLVRRLQTLDADYRRGLAHCARRELVTSHAAFGYLAARYGLVQVPLTGLAPASEPGPGDVARLVDEVRRTGATTVFSEPLVSPALAETVAREAGVRTAVLDPLESLAPAKADAGADYLSVMRDNLTQLREALGCR